MAKQTEWLVFFYENNDFHRSHKFFKKGFKHCGVMSYDPHKKIWLLVEYNFGHLFVETLDPEEVDKIFRMISQKNGKILQVPVKYNLPRFPVIMRSWIKEHSCVSYVQRLLGMSKFWIFTPYQLYCELKKKGFSEIKL